MTLRDIYVEVAKENAVDPKVICFFAEMMGNRNLDRTVQPEDVEKVRAVIRAEAAEGVKMAQPVLKQMEERRAKRNN